MTILEHPQNRKEHLIGIFLIIFAFLCAAILNALVKVVIQTVSLHVILFTQNLLAFVVITPLALRRGWKPLATQQIGLHIARAVTGLISYGLLFLSVKYISLVDATVLGNASPLFLPFVIWVWMGQKITPSLWWGLIIGYAGIFFILRPGMELIQSWMIFLALLASLFAAIALQCVGNLKKNHSVLTILFYFFLLSTLMTLPFALTDWRVFTIDEWKLLLFIGLAVICAQLSLTKAYQFASPTLLGPFNYSVVVFAGVIQWWFWGVIPDWISCIGIFLISGGGLLTLMRLKKR